MTVSSHKAISKCPTITTTYLQWVPVKSIDRSWATLFLNMKYDLNCKSPSHTITCFELHAYIEPHYQSEVISVWSVRLRSILLVSGLDKPDYSTVLHYSFCWLVLPTGKHLSSVHPYFVCEVILVLERDWFPNWLVLWWKANVCLPLPKG